MAAGGGAKIADIRGAPALGRRIMPWYLSGVAFLAILGSAWQSARAELWLALSVTVLGAAVAGPLVNRPAQRAAWLLLAGALALLMIGGGIAVAVDGKGALIAAPSAADVVELLAYPLAASGLLMLVMRRSSALAVMVSAVDALIVLSCLTLLTWLLLIVPLVGPSVPSTAYRAISVAFAFGDVLLLVVSARLLWPGPRSRPGAAWLLAVGALGMLCADVLYSLIELDCINGPPRIGTESAGSLIWLLGACAWGAAALSPAMEQVDRRGRHTSASASASAPSPLGRSQVKVTAVIARSALFVMLALIGPLIALRRGANGVHDYDVLIAILSGVIAVLLAARLGLLLLDLRLQLRVEQNLREVSGIMVGTAEIRQILAAVYQATALQTGNRRPKIVACAVVADHLRTVTAESVDHATDKVPGTAAAEWVRAQFGTEPYVAVAPPGIPAESAGFVVGVSGDEDSLADRIGQLEILASQALLAVNRLVLTRQIAQRSGEEYFRALAENTSDVILIVGPGERVRYATPSAVTVLGVRNPTEVSLAELIGPQNAEWVAERLGRPEEPTHTVNTTTWSLRQSGRGKQALEVACADLRAEPAVGGLVLTLRDVTAQRQLEHELRYHAYYDTVTGLGNRLQFARRVELAMSRSRYGGAPATVLLLDIDDFKELNDVRGREVGDLILVAVAGRLAKVVGDGDVGRLGSDAFGVLAGPGGYGGPSGEADADALARRLVEEISRPFDLPVGVVSISVSVGVASTRGHTRADEVIRSAKLALEAAQADGRRAWRRYEAAMLEEKVEHAALREDLETALHENGFVLHYQPVIDLADGSISSFEALVRWRHPKRGLLAPDRFIPLAEKTGLILPLGRWILQQSARDLARLREASGKQSSQVRVAVNVSARQFAVPGLIDQVAAALDAAGVEPDALVVELTESALVSRKDRAVQDLHALKGLGVKLAIDDFGTGYSSLSYLQDFPFDGLKIDKSFVDDIAISNRRAELIRGIIRIADTLGLYVVGEGVETQVQHRMLTDAGCRFGQGFLYSRPVPVDTAIALLGEGSFPHR
ncbi:MAG TPA: EAL domain-containing protein [Actinocrinis sp.]|nr:EAL domain-containing protein [Actinocrinis sp.]